MNRRTKKITALTLAAACTLGMAGMVHADNNTPPFPLEGKGYKAVDQYGKWIHGPRDKCVDWYNEWIEHQAELDRNPSVEFADPTGKTWLDWWENNH